MSWSGPADPSRATLMLTPRLPRQPSATPPQLATQSPGVRAGTPRFAWKPRHSSACTDPAVPRDCRPAPGAPLAHHPESSSRKGPHCTKPLRRSLKPAAIPLLQGANRPGLRERDCSGRREAAARQSAGARWQPAGGRFGTAPARTKGCAVRTRNSFCGAVPIATPPAASKWRFCGGGAQSPGGGDGVANMSDLRRARPLCINPRGRPRVEPASSISSRHLQALRTPRSRIPQQPELPRHHLPRRTPRVGQERRPRAVQVRIATALNSTYP
jgi:hypothetical protein